MTPARRPALRGQSRLRHRYTRGRIALIATAVAVAATALLAGFRVDLYDVAPNSPGAQGSELITNDVVGIRTFVPGNDVTVTTDVVYGTQSDGALLTLDICSPTPPVSTATPTATATDGTTTDETTTDETTTDGTTTDETASDDTADAVTPDPVLPSADTEAGAGTGTGSAEAVVPQDAAASVDQPDPALRPAVISVHGGSWARGDKGNSDWRLVCQWLASEGFVAYSVNYRLVPDAVFPAAIDDLQLAVEWVRDLENAQEYGIDPNRIGAFGGSAGGNLVALLGTTGRGALTTDARLAAVAELSGPVDLRASGLVDAVDGLTRITQDYLGCENINRCPQSVEASASSRLDRSDPPVFIGTSSDEFIPLSQSTEFAAQLDRLGIRNELVVVPGDLHSIGILNEGMRARVAAFLHTELGW